MEEFKARLLRFIEEKYGMSIRSFEEMCGLTNGVIGSIKVKGPSVDVLLKISNTCPELDLNWLVTGEGEMIKITPIEPIGSKENLTVNEKYIAHLEEEIDILRKEKEILWKMVQK